jgi:hypothetical protein
VQKTKILFIVLVSLFCYFLLILSGCASDNAVLQYLQEVEEGLNELSKTEESRGNSVGNIVNLGRVAQQGDWIYYVYQDSLLSSDIRDLSKGHIYKIRLDGSNQQKINEDLSYYLNVLGDWVYYCNLDDDAKIYKVRTDGTERTKITDEKSSYLNVLGDWIYYCNWDDGGKIYKIRTDGTERTRINNGKSFSLNVIGDWIYYSNGDHDSKIYRIRTDGSDRKKLNEDRSAHIKVIGDWIYYMNWSRGDGLTLYKIKTDGTNRIKLTDHSVYNFNVADNWVYYTNKSDGSMIFKVSTDGEGNALIVDDSIIGHLNVADDWIYYINGSENNELYRIRNDGSQRTPFGNYPKEEATVFEPVIYSVDVDEGSYLFIRKNPGMKGKPNNDILDRVPRGRLLEVLDNRGNNYLVDNFTWWEIKDFQTGITGWVAAEYLIRKDSESETGRDLRNNDTMLNFEQKQRGNTTGNITNEGHAAYEDDWMYFSINCEIHDYESGNFVIWEGIVKVRTDGSSLTFVTHHSAGYINVFDDWIYYRNADDDGKIYKIRTDGSEWEKLSNDDWPSDINVVDGWIYYTISGSGYSDIYKIRTDGSDRIQIDTNGDTATQINVVGDWIYYKTLAIEIKFKEFGLMAVNDHSLILIIQPI